MICILTEHRIEQAEQFDVLDLYKTGTEVVLSSVSCWVNCKAYRHNNYETILFLQDYHMCAILSCGLYIFYPIYLVLLYLASRPNHRSYRKFPFDAHFGTQCSVHPTAPVRITKDSFRNEISYDYQAIQPPYFEF